MKATGTLRALLAAVGWRLERAGRVKARGDGRDALTYRAQGVPLPEGVEAQALAAAWLAELQALAAVAPAGALFAPIENLCRKEKCPTGNPGALPPPMPWPLLPPFPGLLLPLPANDRWPSVLQPDAVAWPWGLYRRSGQ